MAPTVDANFVGPPAPASVRIGQFAEKALTPANLMMAVAGVQAGGILSRGRETAEIAKQREQMALQAEDIAAQRAAIDRKNAIAVRTAAVERAKILAEYGEKLRARQTAGFISGNIKTNVGVPLLVETQTRADIARDMGFDLETGRAETRRFETSALLEERIGKTTARGYRLEAKRLRRAAKRSKWEAIGVMAGSSLAYLGTEQ